METNWSEQKKNQKHIVQITFLMQIRSRIWNLLSFVDRAHKQEMHILPSENYNSDGRLKLKKGEPNGQKSDKCQKDGPLILHLGHSNFQKVNFWRLIAQSWFSKMCFWLERGAHFWNKLKKKWSKTRMQAKMHVATCIFDAKTYQGQAKTIFCQLARQLLMFFENHKIRRAVALRRPGGMRRAVGGRFEGG